MTIQSLTEIKVGHLVEIKSDAAGVDKAPCTVIVGEAYPNGTFISDDADEKDTVFKLDMMNYIGTVDIAAHDDKPAKTLHQFAK